MLFAFALFTGALACALGRPALALGRRIRLTAGNGAPATGGLALAGAWWVAALLTSSALDRPLAGLALAMVPLLTVGLWDLRRPLGPWPQLGAQLVAALAVVLVGGVMARAVTNPAGGLLSLTTVTAGGLPLLAILTSVIWLVVLMNAVNFLDGLDGLAAGVSAIGFVTIAAVSILPQVNEPEVALPALLAAGAAAGFLFWNWPPARLYLGTPGAWFLGLLLGTLSLLGSSKIATLAVVGAIPLLDAASVIAARLFRGSSPVQGDRTHLHHRLLRRGWRVPHILLCYAGGSVALALAAVFLPTPIKVALVVVAGAAVLIAAALPAGVASFRAAR